MNRKTIYLAGGCYWGVEKYVSSIRGVVETEVGFANGSVKDPSYQQVKHGDTGHAETVRVNICICNAVFIGGIVFQLTFNCALNNCLS